MEYGEEIIFDIEFQYFVLGRLVSIDFMYKVKLFKEINYAPVMG